MFGLWFSLIGLIFGTLCSFKAREKDRAQKEWFILGFIFPILSLLILLLLPNNKCKSFASAIIE